MHWELVCSTYIWYKANAVIGSAGLQSLYSMRMVQIAFSTQQVRQHIRVHPRRGTGTAAETRSISRLLQDHLHKRTHRVQINVHRLAVDVPTSSLQTFAEM